MTGAALWALLAAGCAAKPQGDHAEARDSTVSHRGGTVTVRIVESVVDAPSLAAWRIDATPLVDLGAIDGPADAALFRVSGAYRLSDGRVIVADGGSSQLKVFDRSGALIQSIGGPGSGPGEFRQLTYFGRLPGDTVLVWDLGQARITRFGPDGALAGETVVGTAPGSRRSSVAGTFDDGTLLSRGFIDLGGRVPEGLERHESVIFHLAADGSMIDSIGSFPSGEAYFRPFEGGFSFYEPPFARTAEVIASGDRVYVADSEHAEIRILSADGTPRSLVRWTQPRRTVGGAEMDRARERALADAGESRRADVERMFAEMPGRDVMPAFGGMRIARDGDIWVQNYRTEWDEGASTWLVFDDAGALTATVELPAALTPTDIGSDYVLGIERNELDLEFVRLYRLHRN